MNLPDEATLKSRVKDNGALGIWMVYRSLLNLHLSFLFDKGNICSNQFEIYITMWIHLTSMTKQLDK
jgi:hypothetical protein